MAHDLFDPADDGIVLRLHVHPGAGRTAIMGRHGAALKVKVAAPPQDGRANDACLALVADVLGVQRGQVELAGGASSRAKRVRVSAVDPDEVAQLLALALEDASGKPRGGGSVPRTGSR